MKAKKFTKEKAQRQLTTRQPINLKRTRVKRKASESYNGQTDSIQKTKYAMQFKPSD